MDDYISRQIMLDQVDKLKIIPSLDGTGKPTPTEDFRVQFLGTVLKVPAADVVPVVHSRWVLGGYDDMYYVCEKCGHEQSEYYAKPTANFCPNCGARMDGEREE